jgi:hypothetical protein
VLFPARLLLKLDEPGTLVALDSDTGETAWELRVDATLGQTITHLAGADGVAVVVVRDGETGISRVTALDATAGIALWERELPTDRQWHAPVAGEGRVVFPSTRHAPGRLLVLDLFRGVLVSEITGEEQPAHRDRDAVWIEGDVLVLPRFLMANRQARNHVRGYHLETGALAWEHVFADGTELYAILQAGEETYLVVQDQTGGGELVQLTPASGAHRRVMRFSASEKLVGVERKSRVRLPGPLLFLRSHAEGSPLAITAVHLPWATRRWVRPLPVTYDLLYDSGMPMPAQSAGTVAVSYATKVRRGTAPENNHLVLIDAESGRIRDTRVLPHPLSRAESIGLSAFGRALLLLGGELRLEVWEAPR